ncbi:alpha/beta hydrolase [Nitrosospira multiformis]|nr:alpha/beta hydrolase [Nitrosospira multiformis]
MLLSLAIMAALIYVVFAAVIFFAQPSLIYYPEIGRGITGTPDESGLAYESVELETADGERLHGWFVPASHAKATVLFFHGNAGNISQRIDYLSMFYRLGYNTFIFDYRGYGESSGKPTEQGTYRDAVAAWRYITEKKAIPPADVVLFGESLGGAIASWLAAREIPGVLVLASAFTSVPDMGAQLYPYLPIRRLSRFKYNTLEHLKDVSCPVFVAHSPQDEIVPFKQGQALYEAARNPKRFIELQGGHNEGFIYTREDWAKALGKFIDASLGRH